MTVLEELDWRGLIADCTDREALASKLQAGPVTLYAGFDPTADSLHVGNLVPLLALRRFQTFGHRPIALAGGATGAIGDPSGKSAERQLLTQELLEGNVQAIATQLARLLDFEAKDSTTQNAALLLNNADWTANYTYLNFLRDIGKHFTVNKMVAKESVRSRMDDREVGISYTEFSYMLLQAFDFFHLQKEVDCSLQIGGSDQWGNITAGIDLCHRKLQRQVYGLTLPLITNADGSKFGKTAPGAVWLDPAKTSVYRFYQFWIRTDDRDVIRYLKYFTFLDQPAIRDLETKHEADPGRREAHRALAETMTQMIHGEAQTQEAIRASEVLFGGSLEDIGEQTFRDIVGEIPAVEIPLADLNGDGLPMPDLLVTAGLAPSKGQARKDIKGGGANLNNIRVTDPEHRVTPQDLLFGKNLLLRKGKRNYVAVTAVA